MSATLGMLQTHAANVLGASLSSDWLTYLLSSIAATGTVGAAVFYWYWSKKLVQVQRNLFAWQADQKEPKLLTAAAYLIRYVDSSPVMRYPGHSSSSHPHTGFKITLSLNNPGEGQVHVLRFLVRLRPEAYIGWDQRVFRPESRFRYGEFLPHALKNLFLFIQDDAARDQESWPAVDVEVEYVSGSKNRKLIVHCAPPLEGDVGQEVPLHFSEQTVDT